MKPPHYLFVYGTLRKGFDNEVACHLHRMQTYVGLGNFPGKLFRISFYPGAVYLPKSDSMVQGDLFKITTKPTSLFSILDEYEGVGSNYPGQPEFERKQIPINFDQQQIHAHCYLFRGDHSKYPLLPSGIFSQQEH